jgi:zinc and cadmium transporter
MDLIWTVLIASLVGSVFSLFAGALLLTKKLPQHVIEVWGIPFAAGALLAASFLDLLPEAFEAAADPKMVAVIVLFGFLIFFALERFLGWFHHHHEHRGGRSVHPTIGLIVIGDTLHNFIDGLVIGAAFLADPAIGWVITLAIAAHEIPQEVGDFSLLLGYGMRRRNVLLVNLSSALATVVAAVGVVTIGGDISGIEPYLLAIAAGFFIYIAASDIIPTIHAESRMKIANLQTAVLLSAVLLVGLSIDIARSFEHPPQADCAPQSRPHDCHMQQG